MRCERVSRTKSTLITSLTSSTETLATADSDPKTETGKKTNLTYFGEKNCAGKPVSNNKKKP